MREIFSFIFDKFTNPLTLPIEPFKEWIILGFIGLLAYAASFRIVGDMYKDGSINGSFLGSLFHWGIRLLIFVLIWFAVYWVIAIAQWILVHWMLTLSILGGAIALFLVTLFIIRYANPKNQKQQ
ncbi:MAG: hypothetical protein IJB36_01330 [Clostridia bacterium]|nr:hypothetical protein [Clostridia bacterium]